eukprot:m.37524 g.37524  ORF g.37524 m.37524 type:complete len:509 (+) comp9322_c0_seq1:121-1647(+)
MTESRSNFSIAGCFCSHCEEELNINPACKDLDTYLSAWQDNNKDARAASVFSKAGLVAQPTSTHNWIVFISVVQAIAAIGSGFGYGVDYEPILGCVLASYGLAMGLFLKRRWFQTARFWIAFGMWPICALYTLPAICLCTTHGHPDFCFDDEIGDKRYWCYISWFIVLWLVLTAFIWTIPALGSAHLVVPMILFSIAYMTMGAATVYDHAHVSGSVLLVLAISVMLVALYLLWQRRRAVIKANEIIRPYRVEYKKEWGEINTDKLNEWNKLWKEKIGSKYEIKLSWYNISNGSKGVKQTLHTKKLSTLYMQGHVVNDWFQDTVSRLVPPGATFQSCNQIKSHIRAVEKIRRTYFGQVELLCDVVRASIICTSFSQMVQTLQNILNAHEKETIKIVRGKNRFAANYNTERTGGYRDVLLSIKTRGFTPTSSHDFDPKDYGENSMEDFYMTCKNHIAEIQIHYYPMWNIKENFQPPIQENDEASLSETFISKTTMNGHEAYVHYRTIRAN